MAKILDGRAISKKIISDVALEIKNERAKITLAVVLVGEDAASKIYVRKKEEACREAGIISIRRELPSNTSEDALLKLISELNFDRKVDGILVQLPLPPHINERHICSAIAPEKDVDCANPENVGKFYLGEFSLAPCTPKGIIELLESYKINLAGKSVSIIGRSNTVGKPLAMMMLSRDATVTIAHSKTKNLEKHTANADVVVSATGKIGLIKGEMIKRGAIVVDVGINRVGKKVYGDVDFESASKKAGWISPVPGGVGPMTVAALIQNTYYLWKRYHGTQV
ncbi:MAG: bifunctional 5,10-methylenetetrahydrofolate dehydrogenase/5,10-methenyltetrahydrofolate cyclohydrolase [Candidatus Anstonellales archaeon]